jgi:hypothetical protein
MAALAGHALTHFKEKIGLYFSHTIKILALIATVVFLCFPVGIKSERDKEIFEILKLTQYLKSPPQAWGEVSANYDYYWTFLPPLSFSTSAPVHHLSVEQVEEYLQGKNLLNLHDWIFYIGIQDANRLKEKFPHEFNEKLVYLTTVPHLEKAVLIDKKLLPENTYFGALKK